jgi:hypothetical protein
MKKTTSQFLARIKAIEDDEFSFFAALNNPPETVSIQAAEKRLGVQFTPEHRELVETIGCFALVASEEVWPLPKAGEIRPIWQFLRGIELFGVAPQCPTALDIVKQAEAWRPAGRRKLIPAARLVGGSTVIGYGGDQALVEWEKGATPRRLSARSFINHLDGWLTTLVKDKERFKAEWLRRDRSSTLKPPVKRYKDPRWVVEMYDAVIDGKRSCVVCSKPFTNAELKGDGLTGCFECKFRVHDSCAQATRNHYFCKNCF